MNIRCEYCSLFYCAHRKSVSLSNEPAVLSIGDHLDNIIDAYQSDTPIVETKPMTEERVLIAPKTEQSALADVINSWVQCNVCNTRVSSPYLDQHMKAHILSHVRVATSSSSTTHYAYASGNHHTPHRLPPSTSTSSSSSSVIVIPPKSDKPKLSPIERYHFRNMEAVSIKSTSDVSGRYSDMTITFWDEEKPFVQSSVYSGYGSSTISKDWERVCIHIVYDSLDDYYVLTVKLLKRASYSSYDNEEAIPDRICFQEELQTEIKRALLFFCVNPRTAYKLFRKTIREGLSFARLDGRGIVVKSANSGKLNERLNKQSTYSSSSYNSGGYVGYQGDGTYGEGKGRRSGYDEYMGD